MNLLRHALPFIIPAIMCGFLTCAENDSVAGGGSNTGNANILAGIILEADGTTPARCSASLYRSDVLPVRTGEPDTNIISTTATDAEGRFSFSRIEDGTYNIYCTDSTGLFSTLVTDKSIVGNDSFFIGENTLRPNGTIEGQVINAPPGETAIAFIYGSPIITEVNDTSGLFFLRNLPTGTTLSINFITLKTIDGKRCEAQYQYTTLPDTTRFITVTLECDSTGL